MDGWIELNGGVPPMLRDFGRGYTKSELQMNDAPGSDRHKGLGVSSNLNTDKVPEALEADFFRSPNLPFEEDLVRFQYPQNETRLADHDAYALSAADTFGHKMPDSRCEYVFADAGMESDARYIESSCIEIENIGRLDHESPQEVSNDGYSELLESFYTGNPNPSIAPFLDTSVSAQPYCSSSLTTDYINGDANDMGSLMAVALRSRANHMRSARSSRQKGLVSRLCKAPMLNTTFAKKRSARNSFANQLTAVPSSLSSQQFLNCYKKRRVGSHSFTNRTSMKTSEQRLVPSSGFSSESHSARQTSFSSTTSTVSSNLPTITSSKGYPGQFEIDVLGDLQNPAIVQSNVKFGRRLHPNGEFVHTAFALDPRYENLDFTQDNADNDIALFVKLKHAEKKLDEAASDAVAALRSPSEENLRREGQRECSTARLEGVPVGVYRYFQGHLTVEEYKDARMCICWDTCSCNKLCTIYGDIICPCSNAIVLQQD